MSEQFTWPNSPAGTIFEFHDVALVVLFDLHGRSPHRNAAFGVSVPLLGNPERREGIPVNDHDSSCAEMVFEVAGVGTNPA